MKDRKYDGGERDSWPSMGLPAYAPLVVPQLARASAEARGRKVEPQAEWALRTEVDSPKEGGFVGSLD